MNKIKKMFNVTSFTLHIFAMFLMLLDHLWATVVPGNEWMTIVGRLAFPIFAFMIVEGYFHTKNLKKYMLRLFAFALISEIPYNLMVGGEVFYFFQQNVLWTFLIGILLIELNEKAKRNGKIFLRILAAAGSVLIGYVVGYLSLVDYQHVGVLTVLVFYFFRENKWWSYLAQFLLLTYIHGEMLKGQVYEIELFGAMWTISKQAFAVLALIPIWLYNGKQGPYNKAIKQVYYWFYPVHMLILALVVMFR